MSRARIEQVTLDAATHCLKAKRHIALVDVFIEMGKLTREQYEDWRHGRVP